MHAHVFADQTYVTDAWKVALRMHMSQQWYESLLSFIYSNPDRCAIFNENLMRMGQDLHTTSFNVHHYPCSTLKISCMSWFPVSVA